jgi:hypothetical protein
MSASVETLSESFHQPCSSYSNCRCAMLRDDMFCIAHIMHGDPTNRKMGFSRIKLFHYSFDWHSPEIRKTLNEKYAELEGRLTTTCRSCVSCDVQQIKARLKDEKKKRDPLIREEVLARLGRTVFCPPIMRKPSRFNVPVTTLRTILFFEHLCTADCECAPLIERYLELDRQHDENMTRMDMERRRIYDSEIAVREQKSVAHTRLINTCHECPTCRESLVEVEYQIRQADIREETHHGVHMADGTESCTITCSCGPHLAKLLANDVHVKRLNIFGGLYEPDIKRDREAIMAEIHEACATCEDCVKSREPVGESSDSA